MTKYMVESRELHKHWIFEDPNKAIEIFNALNMVVTDAEIWQEFRKDSN